MRSAFTFVEIIACTISWDFPTCSRDEQQTFSEEALDDFKQFRDAGKALLTSKTSRHKFHEFTQMIQELIQALCSC
jgi:hypothetical protein